MKLLRVKANHFKNCCDGFTIDFVPISRKTSEDKEYELLEIAPELYTYSTAAFVGKNASGKTTALELLDCCYSILGDFRLEDKNYEYDGVELEITFFHEEYLYLYETTLSSGKTMGNQASFLNEKLLRKRYYKSGIREIYNKEKYERVMYAAGEQGNQSIRFDIPPEDISRVVFPEDISRVFFVLQNKKTRAIYLDSNSYGSDTYKKLFRALKNYEIGADVLERIIRIFDENIKELTRLDDHNYRVVTSSGEKTMNDTQLVHFLSSGTTKGLLLYTLMVGSLREGFDLIIDEVENHFHKTLVENMLSLYRDKKVNRKNAALIFSTHYIETLDQMGRQDNIWICHADEKIRIANMYEDYKIRQELLKSKRYYENTFGTAVNYDHLMDLKKVLKA